MRNQNQRPAQWAPKGDGEWYNRGYLPHRETDRLTQSLTFRLADTFPQSCMKWLTHQLLDLEEQLVQSTMSRDDVQKSLLRHRFKYIESFLDAGYGACILRRSDVAETVYDALMYFDENKYDLRCWCIMPNHVHVVIKVHPNHSLQTILHSWKSFTSNKINRLMRSSGPVWAREYYDRYVRDDEHMANLVHYIENNPVKAGLVDQPNRWKWSSSGRTRP